MNDIIMFLSILLFWLILLNIFFLCMNSIYICPMSKDKFILFFLFIRLHLSTMFLFTKIFWTSFISSNAFLNSSSHALILFISFWAINSLLFSCFGSLKPTNFLKELTNKDSNLLIWIFGLISTSSA